jgi:hypothetical protein
MNCFARCAESQAPLYCLGEFLEKLRVLGWSPRDVLEVEQSVLRLLSQAREQSYPTSRPALVEGQTAAVNS